MPAVKKAGIVVLGTVVTGLYLAVPAGADPGNDPCRSMFIPICRIAPIMPDLDHDVDLTQDPNGLSGGQDGQVASTQTGVSPTGPGVGPSGG